MKLEDETPGREDSFESTDLSANMEDYMETIALLASRHRVVRVKDIARALKITMPSVTAALGKLREKGLIHYEKYGFIELTDRGRRVAELVYRKHSFLRRFFREVLGMERDSADEEACRIEHHLSPEACRRLYRLVEFHDAEHGAENEWTGRLQGILEEGPLSELREGQSAAIVRVLGDSPLRKRLMDMGFRRGEKITVVKYAPLRDPMELSIKGYHLSLRVEEARDIIVRPLERGRHRRRHGRE
ncbi:MAG TPA: metal-dependent transcriptional regulator [Spirochaetota bacterium]|jgi:DtxR family Mn-dependent transcriptional regulator|nr:metal-dependent transcriptional regulator [Spirochaetota bacterium]OPZ36624.1 MAG: Transcriptional regulator MntR [Spirochaetes bacterium ADurb.BinA120]HNU92534.1 metal-dependent transcriptional regulator [Spirochaetota bacterium]HPI14912.1 metal-dependent transcriptional regulator [Spirochaetota bacterium]HPO46666.1 metal-dependent transcriptional regulator [Spirochaetota bacterium]